MAHLDHSIADLAIILITAGIATILFKWLKQPVVLGYIVAGFIAGPYITWLPTVTEMENVKIWAEIGVIFLLFALGLEFSFKKLIDVGGTATLATLINMGSMIVIGYVVGRLLDWSPMNSIFLGGMLSMSSTTIIIKAFNDMELQKQKFAGIVFGMLIVEDLAAILMMVLLSTVAVSHKFEGGALLNSLFRLIFFVTVWFIVGIYLIPTFLKKAKKYLNDETLLIASIGLCLGMVLFASKVGFSAALGAFIMGSILAETVKAKQIEHLIGPIKNLFGAIFFVSVGMMIDPAVIMGNAGLILILTAVVLAGRIVFATLGVLASGEGLKVAVQSGFSLAQIGEFSFIIATLGMSLGVISGNLYPIIVAVSIITTFTTPYCIRIATPVYHAIEKRLPLRSREKIIEGYARSNLKTVNKQNDWNRLLKSILQLVAMYATISLATIFACEQFITPFITANIPGVWGHIVSATIALLLIAPFLRAIMMKRNRSTEFRNLWDDSHFNRGALISLIALRVSISGVLILMVLIPLFPSYTLLMVVVSMVVTALIIYSQGFKKQSRRMEARFLENLKQKQLHDERSAGIHPKVAHVLLSKDIHIEEIEVYPLSPKAGKTLRELNFRGQMGVSIVTIIRGNRKINIPDANERLYPYDRIIVAGSDENLQKMAGLIEDSHQAVEDEDDPQHHVNLSQFIIESGSPMIGKSLRELDMQKKTECMIVGIERGGESYINVSSSLVLMEGDTLLLAGEKDRLAAFEKNLSLTVEV
ncbi:MAG: cation:proton antiporter [Tannerellaceae bacterium]|jgi:CPA2 family monovalent cation:H+ antiporter-2|nr:cation:proton antiporter [Tannerellaceae bacterium]